MALANNGADDNSSRPVDVEPLPVADGEKPFNGSFGEFFLRGGPLLSGDNNAAAGWHGDLGFRNSFPFYLGDNRLAYSYGRYDVADQAVEVHGVHLSLNIHPFYLVLLSEGLLSHFLASLHLELGLGPRLAMSAGDDGESRRTFGVAGGVGVGFDLPLMAPNGGQGLWLNGSYRKEWSTAQLTIAGDSHRVGAHRIFLGLAWRINGMIW